MSEYDVYLTPSGIEFAPVNETQEILQNVLTICLTQKYTVPLDRMLGVEGEALDEAVSRVRAKYKREVVEAVKKYEPRARVSAIDFSTDLNGRVIPRIRVRIVD
ncbi:MAG: hypothetical protein IJP54_06015 [Synergistaceae bacterium]|nr:hypothetical protein [Synergistaceae bacterium]